VDWKEAMSYKGVITHVDSKDIPGENCLENDNEPLQLFATEKVYICVSILRIFVKSSEVRRFYQVSYGLSGTSWNNLLSL
jgi:xanthine dehydrogenase molybdopterin-binding subunit B